MNISAPRNLTSIGLSKPSGSKTVDGSSEERVIKSVTAPVARLIRATLNPTNEDAPVPGGIEPVSAMKMSPIKPKSELREKSKRFAEEWFSSSANAGWTFRVARKLSENANCGHIPYGGFGGQKKRLFTGSG